jgi:hypothetical protein
MLASQRRAYMTTKDRAPMIARAMHHHPIPKCAALSNTHYPRFLAIFPRLARFEEEVQATGRPVLSATARRHIAPTANPDLHDSQLLVELINILFSLRLKPMIAAHQIIS